MQTVHCSPRAVQNSRVPSIGSMNAVRSRHAAACDAGDTASAARSASICTPPRRHVAAGVSVKRGPPARSEGEGAPTQPRARTLRVGRLYWGGSTMGWEAQVKLATKR
eukprot:6185307-Pleurochrysis_carterae.AAC.5